MFRQGGRDVTHIRTAQLLAEKTAELGEQIWFLKVDFADAFRTIISPHILQILTERVGAAGALAMTKVMRGHSLVPSWLGFVGEAVPAHRGGGGTRESPQLWNILLDEVMAPVIQTWLQEQKGSYLPTLAAADGGRAPRTWADAAPWCNHLGYADNPIWLATNPKDDQRMYSDLDAACRPKGLWSKEEKTPALLQVFREIRSVSAATRYVSKRPWSSLAP